MQTSTNKTEILERVIATGGLNQKDSRMLVNSAIECIHNALIDGENVTVKGFGSLKHTVKAQRAVINPSTKKIMTIPESKTITFKPSSMLLDKMKNSFLYT